MIVFFFVFYILINDKNFNFLAVETLRWIYSVCKRFHIFPRNCKKVFELLRENELERYV